jgi:predicted transposase YdaD
MICPICYTHVRREGRRVFAILEDILEESWTYKEIIKKGMQKGLEKGREEERLQWIHEQQETLLSFVQMRFPELVSLAKQQTAPIKDPKVLHKLIVQLFGVQTAEEAKRALMEAGIQN